MISYKRLLFLVAAFSLQSRAAEPNCFGDAQHASQSLDPIGVSARLDQLLESRTPDHEKIHAAVVALKESHERNQQRAAIFGAESPAAIAKLDEKFAKIIRDLEAGRLEPQNVGEQIKLAYRQTFEELGHDVIHMEDEVVIAKFWPLMFGATGRKLTQTNRGAVVQFWIEQLNPNKTKLFLDNDVVDGHGQGLQLVKQALARGYRNIYMVSGNNPDSLNEQLKEAGAGFTHFRIVPYEVELRPAPKEGVTDIILLEKPMKGPTQAMLLIDAANNQRGSDVAPRAGQ